MSELTELEAEIHPNLKLLSNSSDTLLEKCARKFELYKLSPDTQRQEAKSISSHEELMYFNAGDTHLDFGTVTGIGTQEYLVSGNKNAAMMKMFLAWENSIDDESSSGDRKNFWNALGALDSFIGLRHTALGNYDLAVFDDKPAAELGFIIDCGNGFSYRGFLDALLIDKMRGKLIPYEGKTTKFRNIHEAVYKNSGQGLGYSLVIDAVAQRMGRELESSFDVLYNVWKTSANEWEIFRFNKNHTQRALWIKSLLLRIQQIETYASIGYFPQHGWNCYDFFRPCKWFGVCEMDNSSLFPGVPKEKKDDPSRYQFHFKLEELIEAQLLKQESVL